MVMLKFEDDIWNTNASYEYINSERIFRIRIRRKRIKIYMYPSTFNYIYIGKTKHNIEELKKINIHVGESTW